MKLSARARIAIVTVAAAAAAFSGQMCIAWLFCVC